MRTLATSAFVSGLAIGVITLLVGVFYLAGWEIPLFSRLLRPGVATVWGWWGGTFMSDLHFRAWTVPVAVVVNTIGGTIIGGPLWLLVSTVRRRIQGEDSDLAGPQTTPSRSEVADAESRAPRPVERTGPVVVSLSDIVNEMVELTGEQIAFLNRQTGELIAMTEPQRTVLENGDPADDLPPAQRSRMPELRELFDANTCLELPSRYEAQEYSMRERYCQTIKNADQRSQLLDALKTSKAFRSFNGKIRRLGLTESWEGYRDKAFEQIAVGWLKKNKIEYR